MLGLSRWVGKGGSYRTLQRFYTTAIPWVQVFWQFFRQHLLRKEAVRSEAEKAACQAKKVKSTEPKRKR